MCVCEGMNGIDEEEGGGKEEVRKRERVEGGRKGGGREGGGREGGREGGRREGGREE